MQDMNDEGGKEVIFEVLDVTDVFSWYWALRIIFYN